MTPFLSLVILHIYTGDSVINSFSLVFIILYLLVYVIVYRGKIRTINYAPLIALFEIETDVDQR